MYPVNSIYLSIDERNPNTIFGFGSWKKISQNKCLMGANDTNTSLGQNVDAGLPLPNASVSVKIPSGYSKATSKSNAGNRLTRTSKSSPSDDTGDFTPTSNITFNNSGVYGKSTTVQPPALIVNIWQRMA